MKTLTIVLTVGWLGLGSLAAAPVVRAEDAKSHPDLTGEWRLNRDLSSQPRTPEDGGGEGRGRGRGGPGGGGPGGGFGGFGGGDRGGGPGGFGGGGFGGGRSGGDPEKMREQMQGAQGLLTDAPVSMVVTYTDPKLAIASADGRTRTLYTDKRKQKTANGNAEVQARWDNDRIVAETKFGSIKVIETYALGADGQQLIVTAKIEGMDGGGRGGAPPMELRRVYERVARDQETAPGR